MQVVVVAIAGMVLVVVMLPGVLAFARVARVSTFHCVSPQTGGSTVFPLALALRQCVARRRHRECREADAPITRSQINECVSANVFIPRGSRVRNRGRCLLCP